MTIRELFAGLDIESSFGEESVLDLARDSRQVQQGSLFFCIKGVESDGHSYGKQALEKGAVGIVVEQDLGLPNQIVVESTHYAYGLACGNYYGNPSRKLKLIGVTGTNGKTTIAYIVKGILETAGKKVGLIGTIENLIGDISIQAKHTTPDPKQLHALFARMEKAGCEYVVMEVSSHAMHQQRMAGCHFVSAGFTNLTQDHLDYHGTMDNYYEAKKSLFAMSDYAVVNIDDAYGRRLTEEVPSTVVTCSIQKEHSDLKASDISFSRGGSRFTLDYKGEEKQVEFIQPGEFSVSNALVAGGLCLCAGLSPDQVIDGLKHCPSIPGRFEIFPTHTDYTVLRDFAHSPDGLEKTLGTIRQFAEGRIITLFGCAGERDRTKRKTMAAVVANYSDLVVMTADNPRSEPIDQILNDALPGLVNSGTEYKTFEDRFEAIRWTLSQCKPNDYLILAGKGHEDYQVLDYGSINFNEREIVLELLR